MLSAIATPLVAIFLGPAIPPGNGSAQATEQVFDNEVLVAVSTPVCVFVLLFLGYALVVVPQPHGGEIVDGPPLRGDARIQILWIVVTERDRARARRLRHLRAAPERRRRRPGAERGVPSAGTKAMDVQVIGQQWEFTYRYPTSAGSRRRTSCCRRTR